MNAKYIRDFYLRLRSSFSNYDIMQETRSSYGNMKQEIKNQGIRVNLRVNYIVLSSK
jgi:hypothetical protein